MFGNGKDTLQAGQTVQDSWPMDTYGTWELRISVVKACSGGPAGQ